jgi:hypothetical protein
MKPENVELLKKALPMCKSLDAYAIIADVILSETKQTYFTAGHCLIDPWGNAIQLPVTIQ